MRDLGTLLNSLVKLIERACCDLSAGTWNRPTGWNGVDSSTCRREPSRPKPRKLVSRRSN
jgi:hypothetical protein